MENKKIYLISAVDSSYGIGYNGDLLFKEKEDFKNFRSKTLGKPVIMGRKTFESLPIKPLQGRKNIIISKNFSYKNCVVCTFDNLYEHLEEENFVIGGHSTYEYFLPFADKIYLTVFRDIKKADVYFPSIDWTKFKLDRIDDRGKFYFLELSKIIQPLLIY